MYTIMNDISLGALLIMLNLCHDIMIKQLELFAIDLWLLDFTTSISNYGAMENHLIIIINY